MKKVNTYWVIKNTTTGKVVNIRFNTERTAVEYFRQFMNNKRKVYGPFSDVYKLDCRSY